MATKNSQQREEYYASEWQEKESLRREKFLKSLTPEITKIVENRKTFGIKLFDLLNATARALSVPTETATEAIDAAQQLGLIVVRSASFVTFYFTPEFAPPPDAELYLGYQTGRGSIAKIRGSRKSNKRVTLSEVARKII